MRARLLCVALLMSCAGSQRSGGAHWLGARVPVPPTREDLLDRAADGIARGDLVVAGDALTTLADRERKRPDRALDFWSELLALARCEPLPRVPRVSAADPPLVDPWDRLRRLVQIERVRLARNAEPPKEPPTMLTPARAAARTPGRVTWPLEPERWPDETPVPVLVERCPANPPALARNQPEHATDPEIALVSVAASTLPPDHPAAAPLSLEAAVLDLAHARPGRAVTALARLDSAGGAAAPPLDPGERRSAVLAAALAAIDDPSIPVDRVVATGRAALLLDLSPPAQRALALRLADRLTAAQRPNEAVAILGPPPHGEDALGRYIAFRQTEAHARANRRAELLAEAREALHRHGRQEVAADPALSAIMDMALRTLRASPVSPETMEVLEALGPPRERLERAEDFAAAALDGGAPLSAMTTFGWLYENDTEPRRQLKHLARECVAAARGGARAEFARTFHLLAGQEGSDESQKNLKANPKKADDGGLIASLEAEQHRDRRRATLSVDWQQALLVVARDAVTALVDSDDQPDLATLVATLKRHLDAAGRGPVDDELTTLYRAASAHLKSGPRAYAETVGAEHRPILLGNILVGREYAVERPQADLGGALEETGTLVFVPSRGSDPSLLHRWSPGVALASGGAR
ncbi:MAG TPA: hypothetical protein VMT03_27385 [Polyangia bacterium]|nr:hypothetical protein [Polyangia bacterium]